MSNNNSVLVADFINAVKVVATEAIQNAGLKVSSLNVKLGGPTASTIWTITPWGVDATVYFPGSVDMLGRMSRETADSWCAYWIHEIGHNLYTDRQTWDRCVRDGISGTVNALEDIRIEGLLASRKVATNAKALLETLCNEKLDEARVMNGGALDFVKNYEGFLCYAGRQHILGYDLGTLEKDGLASLPKAYASLALETWAKVAKCQSTEDIRVVAVWLKSKLKDLQAKTPETGNDLSTDEARKDPGKGEGAKGEGQGDKPDDCKGEGQGEGNGDEGDEDGKGEGEGKTPGNGGSGAGNGSPDLSPDLAPSDTGSKPEDGQTMTPHDVDSAQNVMDMSQHTSTHKTGEPPANARSMSETDDLPLTGQLDADVAKLVKAPAKTSRKHHRESGRLSRRDTVRVVMGAKNVFSKRKYTPAKNTAVMVLVDMSSSMSGSNALYAEQAARMFTRAIEKAGGLVCVAGFEDGFGGPRLRIVKPFERHSAIASSADLRNVHGGTPMSPSIIQACKVLRAERKATRRLLVVLTDGGCNMGVAGTRFAVRYAKANGIASVGIGIGCNPGPAFPVRVAVSDVRQLGEEGLGVILNAIGSMEDAA